MNDLEQRVKALEELMQRVTDAFIATPRQVVATVQTDVGDIALKFPEELRQHLTITENTIKTKFVSKELWNEMDKIARGLGYKYVSAADAAGKGAHWRHK